MADNDREALATIIGRNIPDGSNLKAADAILARWRLVPVEDADPCAVCGDCQCPECGSCQADHS